MKKTPLLHTLASLTLGLLPAQAALIASESFFTVDPGDGDGGPYDHDINFVNAIGSNPNPNVVAGNSGFTAANVWTRNSGLFKPRTTSSLTHSGLTDNGTGSTSETGGVLGSHTGAALSRNIYRNLGSSLADTDSTYYLSALVRHTTFDNTGDAYAIGMSNTTSGLTVFDTDTGFHLGLSNSGSGAELTAWSGGSSYSLGSSTAGTTYQVILGLTTSTTGAETLNAWVAADGATSLTQVLTNQSIAASAYATGADLSTLVFNITKGGTGSTPVATIDEMRFGTTLADVTTIPEPTTALLGGLSLLGLLRRRRA